MKGKSPLGVGIPHVEQPDFLSCKWQDYDGYVSLAIVAYWYNNLIDRNVYQCAVN